MQMNRIITVLDKKTLGNVPALEDLSRFGRIEEFPITNAEETIHRIRHSEIVITNKVVIGKREMEAAENLKLICVAATGMNNIDLEAAAEMGIQVKNVSAYSTASVAQHTFAMLFSLLNHISAYDHFVKSGAYSKADIFTQLDPEIEELEGKVFGIIGLGTIGRKVAETARFFGAEAIYYSSSGKHDDPEYKRVDLEDLLSSADVVSVHAPLNDRTKDLVSMSQLALMKASSILLNTGRGGIVNERDLVEALDKKMIRAAAIDVFSSEPLPADHPFLHVKEKSRLLLSPHIAWAGKKSRERLVKGIIRNIEEFIG